MRYTQRVTPALVEQEFDRLAAAAVAAGFPDTALWRLEHGSRGKERVYRLGAENQATGVFSMTAHPFGMVLGEQAREAYAVLLAQRLALEAAARLCHR